jgi:hypothetical protein
MRRAKKIWVPGVGDVISIDLYPSAGIPPPSGQALKPRAVLSPFSYNDRIQELERQVPKAQLLPMW